MDDRNRRIGDRGGRSLQSVSNWRSTANRMANIVTLQGAALYGKKIPSEKKSRSSRGDWGGIRRLKKVPTGWPPPPVRGSRTELSRLWLLQLSPDQVRESSLREPLTGGVRRQHLYRRSDR